MTSAMGFLRLLCMDWARLYSLSVSLLPLSSNVLVGGVAVVLGRVPLAALAFAGTGVVGVTGPVVGVTVLVAAVVVVAGMNAVTTPWCTVKVPFTLKSNRKSIKSNLDVLYSWARS